MNDPRTSIPCTVTWCESATHPEDVVLHHGATIAAYTNVTVVLSWAQRLDGKPTVGPGIQVFRGQRQFETLLDLVPMEARLWAGVLAGLAPAEVEPFACALLKSAAVLESAGVQE